MVAKPKSDAEPLGRPSFRNLSSNYGNGSYAIIFLPWLGRAGGLLDDGGGLLL